MIFRGGQRSFEVTGGQMVKTLKIACKHDISRRVSMINLIFGVKVGHIE